MVSTVFTLRPPPDRRLPLWAGSLAVALALPIFALGSWSLRGWALGATLWLGSLLLGLLLDRAGIGAPSLRGSGLFGLGRMARGMAVGLVLIALAAAEPSLALAAALVYTAGYTLELALGLALYFSGESRG